MWSCNIKGITLLVRLEVGQDYCIEIEKTDFVLFLDEKIILVIWEDFKYKV